MSTSAQPGQHLAAARKLLDDLQPITGDPGGDAQTRATAAAAEALLALAEQVFLARQEMRGQGPITPRREQF